MKFLTRREIMAWLLITLGGITLRYSVRFNGFKEFIYIVFGYMLIYFAYYKLSKE